jgi:hypothetical protein
MRFLRRLQMRLLSQRRLNNGKKDSVETVYRLW